MRLEIKKMENGFVLVKYPKSEGLFGIGKGEVKKFVCNNIDEMLDMIRKFVEVENAT